MAIAFMKNFRNVFKSTWHKAQDVQKNSISSGLFSGLLMAGVITCQISHANSAQTTRAASAQAAQPAQPMLVSVHPLFMIAEAVTAGIEKPQLLIPRNISGHDHQLTPKNRQQLQNSNLILWLGPQHESTLQATLASYPQAIALLKTPLLQTLPLRDVRGQAVTGSVDSHVWLAPQNAIRIAFYIATVRGRQYPAHHQAYLANARQFAKQLLAAHKQIGRPATAAPYWAYHDAYHYLEDSLNLSFKGALTPDEELSPTAAQIKYLIDQRPANSACLIAEYTPDAQLLQRLKPRRVVNVGESLTDYDNFVTGWQDVARRVTQCVR